MPTRINLVPSGGPSAPTPSVRRLSFNRPLAIGAALALWAAILVVLRLLTI